MKKILAGRQGEVEFYKIIYIFYIACASSGKIKQDGALISLGCICMHCPSTATLPSSVSEVRCSCGRRGHFRQVPISDSHQLTFPSSGSVECTVEIHQMRPSHRFFSSRVLHSVLRSSSIERRHSLEFLTMPACISRRQRHHALQTKRIRPCQPKRHLGGPPPASQVGGFPTSTAPRVALSTINRLRGGGLVCLGNGEANDGNDG